MAGLHDAFLNKTGQFAKPVEKSKTPPVIAAFSSEITLTQEDQNEVSIDDAHPGDFSFASIEDVDTRFVNRC